MMGILVGAVEEEKLFPKIAIQLVLDSWPASHLLDDPRRELDVPSQRFGGRSAGEPAPVVSTTRAVVAGSRPFDPREQVVEWIPDNDDPGVLTVQRRRARTAPLRCGRCGG
jgi:hypothetical protein